MCEDSVVCEDKCHCDKNDTNISNQRSDGQDQKVLN